MKMKIWEKLLAVGSLVVSVSALVFLTALGPGTVTFPNTIPYGATFGAGGEFHSTTAIVSNSNPDLGINIGQQVMTGSLPVAIASNQSAIPVSQSGTWPITQSGVWTVTANLGTLNGAATAAKQPALGTAGTASTDVITVQGPSSGGLPIPVSSGVTDGGTATSQTYSPIAGKGETTASACTTATECALSVDTSRNLRVTTPTNGATGAAPPAAAQYLGANAGGNLTGLISCNLTAKYDASTSGSTQLVALSGSTNIRVCGYTIFSGGTANVKLTSGTGSACATGAADLTPAFQLTAQTGAVDGSPFWRGLSAGASNALCINSSAAVAVQALVYYTQF